MDFSTVTPVDAIEILLIAVLIVTNVWLSSKYTKGMQAQIDAAKAELRVVERNSKDRIDLVERMLEDHKSRNPTVLIEQHAKVQKATERELKRAQEVVDEQARKMTKMQEELDESRRTDPGVAEKLEAVEKLSKRHEKTKAAFKMVKNMSDTYNAKATMLLHEKQQLEQQKEVLEQKLLSLHHELDLQYEDDEPPTAFPETLGE